MTSEAQAQQPTKVCMLDIETLDIVPGATILSLGAVDVYGTDTFYVEFDRFQGRSKSDQTVEWWKSLPIAMPDGITDLKSGLEAFATWYKKQTFTEAWCIGSDFDFVILSNAYRSFDLETPWRYNHVRDFRTLSKLFPQVPNPAPYKVHHALLDAVCQAQHLKEIMNYVIRTQVHPGCNGCASQNQLRGANFLEQWKGKI